MKELMIDDNYGYLDECRSDDYNKGYADGFNQKDHGILIKDHKMPQNCVECPCIRLDGKLYVCQVKNVIFGHEDDGWIHMKRPNWCPLKGV